MASDKPAFQLSPYFAAQGWRPWGTAIAFPVQTGTGDIESAWVAFEEHAGRGDRLSHAGDPHQLASAIEAYTAAIDALRPFKAALSDARCQDLANAYANRGTAKRVAPGFGLGAAIADHDAAIALMEVLQQKSGANWPLSWRNELANSYMNRGNAKRVAPGFGPGAAIADYDTSIALKEALRKELGAGWPPDWRDSLAGTYTNRGNAKHYAPGFGPAAAITDHNAAIALRETLQDEPDADRSRSWRFELARAHENRGIAKQYAPGFGPGAAISDYDAAISLMEALRDENGTDWPLDWRFELANAYMNRGYGKQHAPGFGPGAAITDYDAAISLMEALREELGADWPPDWRRTLSLAYLNRGNARRSAPGFGAAEARDDYRRALDYAKPIVMPQQFLAPAVDVFLKASRLSVIVLRQLKQSAANLGVADEGLRVARLAEQLGVNWYRDQRELLFAEALRAYADAGKQALLPQIIFAELDPDQPGSAVDSAAMQQAAMAALASALAEARAGAGPGREALISSLLSAQLRLFSLQVRQFAGSAALARMRAGAEAAAGRPEEALRIMTRLIEYRPQDPACLAARADLHCLLGRRAEAEADVLGAAQLTVMLRPNPSSADLSALGSLGAALLRLRLAPLAEDPRMSDPAQARTLTAAFDQLLLWLTVEMPKQILARSQGSVSEQWRQSLPETLAQTWFEAEAVRATLMMAQQKTWEGDLRAKLQEETENAFRTALGVIGKAIGLPWAEFIQGVLLAARDAHSIHAKLPEEERVEAIAQAMARETERLDAVALQAGRRAVAAALGGDFEALLAEEQRYLACARQAADTPPMAAYATLQLGLAVEWSLLHRVLAPWRAAVQAGQLPPPADDRSKLYGYLANAPRPLMLGDTVRAFTEATKRVRAPDDTPPGAIARWLLKQPNAVALHDPESERTKRRRSALHRLSEERNNVTHPNKPPPIFEPHWQAMVADRSDAYFRYLPAVFAGAAGRPAGA
jgi:hypothetical protein